MTNKYEYIDNGSLLCNKAHSSAHCSLFKNTGYFDETLYNKIQDTLFVSTVWNTVTRVTRDPERHIVDTKEE